MSINENSEPGWLTELYQREIREQHNDDRLRAILKEPFFIEKEEKIALILMTLLHGERSATELAELYENCEFTKRQTRIAKTMTYRYPLSEVMNYLAKPTMGGKLNPLFFLKKRKKPGDKKHVYFSIDFQQLPPYDAPLDIRDLAVVFNYAYSGVHIQEYLRPVKKFSFFTFLLYYKHLLDEMWAANWAARKFNDDWQVSPTQANLLKIKALRGKVFRSLGINDPKNKEAKAEPYLLELEKHPVLQDKAFFTYTNNLDHCISLVAINEHIDTEQQDKAKIKRYTGGEKTR